MVHVPEAALAVQGGSVGGTCLFSLVGLPSKDAPSTSLVQFFAPPRTASTDTYNQIQSPSYDPEKVRSENKCHCTREGFGCDRLCCLVIASPASTYLPSVLPSLLERFGAADILPHQGGWWHPAAGFLWRHSRFLVCLSDWQILRRQIMLPTDTLRLLESTT